MSWSLFTIGMTELPKGAAAEEEEDVGEGGTCSFAMDDCGLGKDGVGVSWNR